MKLCSYRLHYYLLFSLVFFAKTESLTSQRLKVLGIQKLLVSLKNAAKKKLINCGNGKKVLQSSSNLKAKGKHDLTFINNSFQVCLAGGNVVVLMACRISKTSFATSNPPLPNATNKYNGIYSKFQTLAVLFQRISTIDDHHPKKQQ